MKRLSRGFWRENAAVLVFVKGFRGMRANDVRPYGAILYILYVVFPDCQGTFLRDLLKCGAEQENYQKICVKL